MIKTYFKGVGIMVGLIFGAGIFALPFVIYKAGLLWGLAHFLIAIGIILLLHFLYAEVAFLTEGKHRFTGYVRLTLGKKAEFLAFLVTILAYYGSLLAYGVLGGFFLNDLFGDLSTFIFSLLFFAFGSILLILKLDKMAMINFYLTVPLLGFVIYMFLAILPFVDFGNFSFSGFDFKNLYWFLPYGIWIFSLSGFAAVPEVRDLFSSLSLKHFKTVISISILGAALFYWLFIIAIIGISGANTSPDSISGIPLATGKSLMIVGAIIGFLAVFTSFLALGIDLKLIYHLDFNIPKIFAWMIVFLPPVGLFLLGVNNFTRILGIVGSVGLGVTGNLIILMARKKRKPEKKGCCPTFSDFIHFLAALAISLAVLYEIWNILKQ
jgi:amino acid permease